MKCEHCNTDLNEDGMNFCNSATLDILVHQNTHIINLLSKIEARQDRLEKQSKGFKFEI